MLPCVKHECTKYGVHALYECCLCVQVPALCMMVTGGITLRGRSSPAFVVRGPKLRP